MCQFIPVGTTGGGGSLKQRSTGKKTYSQKGCKATAIDIFSGGYKSYYRGALNAADDNRLRSTNGNRTTVCTPSSSALGQVARFIAAQPGSDNRNSMSFVGSSATRLRQLRGYQAPHVASCSARAMEIRREMEEKAKKAK